MPCGEHDTPKQSSVRLYCPNCKDIYIPPNPKYHDIDGNSSNTSIVFSNYSDLYIFFFTGSHFGTTFPHLFFQAFPETIKVVEPNIYVAKLFGFRISELSAVGPRMQWLRMVKDKPAATAADGEEDEDANEMAA